VLDNFTMRIREILAQATVPGGGSVVLARDGDAYTVTLDGLVLMSSAEHGSEQAMATVACAHLAGQSGARVAVGGLGLGYTLRAALDQLSADARVTVVEFLPALIDWNRDPLAHLAGRPLDDPRVTLEEGDFVAWIKAGPAPFDAILLDLDNGPEAFTTTSNAWLYSPDGLGALRSALRPNGVLVVWSAFESARFESRLRAAGFSPETMALRGRPGERKGSHHRLYIGRRSPPGSPQPAARVRSPHPRSLR